MAGDEERLARARLSLDGLSVGDAFGEKFFVPVGMAEHYIETRKLPDSPWHFTDDTNMALSIVSILRQYGEINQEMLALNFAGRFDPSRGYGAGMHVLLIRVAHGADWYKESNRLFSGQGSFGNGAAMRVAPLGAYFANNLEAVVDNARRSAEVTHAHPEGIAGAIAVAVATALACQLREAGTLPSRREFLEQILPHVPNSVVSEKIRHARELAPSASLQLAVSALGNGTGISAQDTVAFVLWCAGGNLDNYEEALWLTVSGLGDRDTTCAMVGGIVAMYTGAEGIPAQWLESREPLPGWPFQEA